MCVNWGYETGGHRRARSIGEIYSRETVGGDYGAAGDRSGQKFSGDRGLSQHLANSGLSCKRSLLLGTDGSWMANWGPTTLSSSGCAQRIRLSFWTSRWSAALGEQFADHANVRISGVGFCHTGIRAGRFSEQQLPITHPMRRSTCFAGRRLFVGFSRTQPPLGERSGKRVNRKSIRSLVGKSLAGVAYRSDWFYSSIPFQWGFPEIEFMRPFSVSMRLRRFLAKELSAQLSIRQVPNKLLETKRDVLITSLACRCRV
jgi:hypothetical protein